MDKTKSELISRLEIKMWADIALKKQSHLPLIFPVFPHQPQITTSKVTSANVAAVMPHSPSKSHSRIFGTYSKSPITRHRYRTTKEKGGDSKTDVISNVKLSLPHSTESTTHTYTIRNISKTSTKFSQFATSYCNFIIESAVYNVNNRLSI